MACEHYNRFAEDIALMVDLGVDAYRLTTSWSRTIPNKSRKPNTVGLGFYDRLVDALHDKGSRR